MWAHEHLGRYVRGDTIVLPSGVTVDVASFEAMFADAIAAGGTYAACVAADYQEDDEGRPIVNRGYRAFFDQLKAEGLLT